MRELDLAPNHLWFTPQIRKLFMDSCSYYAIESDHEGQQAFSRRIRLDKPVPRFHLIVTPKAIGHNFNLHFDVREHYVDHYGSDVPVELQRINTILNQLPTSYADDYGVGQLRKEIAGLMMYGAYEDLRKPRQSFSGNFPKGARKVLRKQRTPRPIAEFKDEDYIEG